MEEQKVFDFMIMYKELPGEMNPTIAFTVSLVFFFLYMILQLIELNTFIKNMEVLDVTKTTRGTLVYVYLVGYFSFMFKLFLQLFTVVILLTLIFWIIMGICHIWTHSQSGGKLYNSAAEMKGGSGIEQVLQKWAGRAFTNVMGVVLINNFFLVFFIIIPLLLLFFIIIFAQFYNRDMIIDNDSDKSTRIMLTNHNFMMMIITMLIVFGIIILASQYYKCRMDGTCNIKAAA